MWTTYIFTHKTVTSILFVYLKLDILSTYSQQSVITFYSTSQIRTKVASPLCDIIKLLSIVIITSYEVSTDI